MDLTKLGGVLSILYKKPARVAIMGIGNSLRSDDFIGVAVVQQLKEKIQKDSVLLIEAEIAPTSFFHVIQEWNPSHLLIIDASDFKSKPGTFNLIKREQMATFTLTSHKMALTLLIDLLFYYLPDLKIDILGIQPASLEFTVDTNLSPIMREVLEKLINILIPILSKL